VSIACTDVVLDEELTSRAGHRGAEARMFELERCGLFDPRHEGADERTVFIENLPDPRAVQILLREAPLQRKQGLVSIHHQPVQAVCPAAGAGARGGDGRDEPWGYTLIGKRRQLACQLFLPRA